MPRSNRPKRGRGGKREEPEELDLDRVRRGIPRTVVKRGVEYTVQTSTGSNSEDGKSWVCPHCNMPIQKGLAHTVAWDAVRGLDTRRHFHNACWTSFQGPLL